MTKGMAGHGGDGDREEEGRGSSCWVTGREELEGSHIDLRQRVRHRSCLCDQEESSSQRRRRSEEEADGSSRH